MFEKFLIMGLFEDEEEEIDEEIDEDEEGVGDEEEMGEDGDG